VASPYSLAELLLARLTGTPGLAVYDAQIATNPPNTGWVIVYPGAGTPATTRLAPVATDLVWDATVVCCGRSRSQCLNTVSIVRSRLLGVRLDNARSSGRLTEEPAGPLLPDESIPAEPRFSLTLRYTSTHTRS
jgi:hypothetical protein